MARKKAATKLAGELTDVMATADDKGYFGTVPDKTPNEHYTLAGVTGDKPTPETDREGAPEDQAD